MIRLIFLILTVIGGLVIIKMGISEVKEGSFKENILHAVFDIFLGGGTTHGCGTVVIGIGILLIGILALIFGWGK